MEERVPRLPEQSPTRLRRHHRLREGPGRSPERRRLEPGLDPERRALSSRGRLDGLLESSARGGRAAPRAGGDGLEPQRDLGELPLTLWRRGGRSAARRGRAPLRRVQRSFILALGAQVYLPTGSAAHLAGDGDTRFIPRLMIAGDLDAFTYAVRFGYMIRRTTARSRGTVRRRALDGRRNRAPFSRQEAPRRPSSPRTRSRPTPSRSRRARPSSCSARTTASMTSTSARGLAAPSTLATRWRPLVPHAPRHRVAPVGGGAAAARGSRPGRHPRRVRRVPRHPGPSTSATT